MKKCRMEVFLRVLSDDDAFVFGGDSLGEIAGIGFAYLFLALCFRTLTVIFGLALVWDVSFSWTSFG